MDFWCPGLMLYLFTHEGEEIKQNGWQQQFFTTAMPKFVSKLLIQNLVQKTKFWFIV